MTQMFGDFIVESFYLFFYETILYNSVTESI